VQTRCLSCGKTIDGIAQFCDVCQEQQPVAPPSPIDREAPATASQVTPSGHAINIGFISIVGCCLIAAAVWLLAFGGAEKVGLRNENSSSVKALAPSATQSPAASAATLGFEHAPCKFSIPTGENADCGYLTVPESRTQTNGRTIRLPVAVLKSSSAERKPDPIVYLDGGPGADTLQELAPLDEALKPLLAGRDLVVFDQRGAGYSEPSLDCPEITQLNYDDLKQQFTVDQRVAQDAESVTRCHNRLVSKGIDPALASSAESATDVNDLRLALGYDRWNLYGVSYGTKLALTVMRDFPQGVRSVVLDSVYPLQANLYTASPEDFDRALKVLFESCAADAHCSSAYPNLEAAFYETVRTLNEKPVILALGGGIFGRPIEGAVIDGDWFAAFMFQSLYSTQLIPLLPQAIFDTRHQNWGLLTTMADGYLQDANGLSPGMYLSVQCGEELPFTTREAAIAAADANPQLSSFNEYKAKSIFASCEVWQARAAASRENEAVTSDIPTLVLSGQFDPITPPAWGRMVAKDLSNSFYFEFPGVGHGVAFADECPGGIALAFLNDPQQRPPSGCIDGMSRPRWIVN
jgi:pimeloyl-ACP methyl ester carboxylesterase